MITLKQTLLDQENLSQLCLDTPPRPLNTNEIFNPNAFYGNDVIYKLYAGLPIQYTLKAMLPHGPTIYTHEKIWSAELINNLSEIWCYSNLGMQRYSQALKRLKIHKNIVLCASPFLYLLKLLKSDAVMTKRQGTIFFPSHSTHHIKANADFQALASKLDALAEEYHPITVCIYWKDFNLGHHLPFANRGMKIVSAGHMFDPYFLFRFYHLCSLHQYSCSNEYGTSVLYSIKSGCSYFHLDSNELYCNSLKSLTNPKPLPDDPATYIPTQVLNLEEQIDRLKYFTDLFTVPQPYPTSEQVDFADEILGYEFIKTPGELQDQIMVAERKYVANAENAFVYQQVLKNYLANNLKQSLHLRHTNLIIFPDPNQSEQSIYQDLVTVITTLENHPDCGKITLLVNASKFPPHLTQAFTEQLCEEEEEGLQISVVGKLSSLEWSALLPQVTARIVLAQEDGETMAQLPIDKVPSCGVDGLNGLTVDCNKGRSACSIRDRCLVWEV